MVAHASQQRVSCETCRRRKIQCRRLQPDDVRCVRCTTLNVDCDVGAPKAIGRPKRLAQHLRTPPPEPDQTPPLPDLLVQAAIAPRPPSPATALARIDVPTDIVGHIARAQQFSLGSLVTFYLREDKFLTAPGSYLAAYTGINACGARSRLAGLFNGLQLRCTLIEHNPSKLDLDVMIYREGPLFLNNHSLGEYLMAASQELLRVLEGLATSELLRSSPGRRLPDDIVGYIIGVYAYIISLAEVFVPQFIARFKCITTRPVEPIQGMMLDAVPLVKSSAQGVLFLSTVVNLFTRLEHILGLTATSRSGLLLKEQVDMLWDCLERGPRYTSSKEMMRPVVVKDLLMRIVALLPDLPS